MTSSATDRILYQAVQTHRLAQRYPLRAKGENKRFLYVTPMVRDGLAGTDPALSHLPMVEMELIIATFCAGYRLTASLLGNPKNKRPQIERLMGLDEVWAVCARTPSRKQVRMFGRFIEPGKFVGLQLHDRKALDDFKTYTRKASSVLGDWSSIFGALQPFRGSTLQEYLGEQVLDVDQI